MKMVQEKLERVEFIDIFRGIGILMMIMGHIGFGGEFDYFIHAFHMPMFFFISGYFYKQKDISIKKFIIQKSKTLLIPYITFGLFHYGIWCGINLIKDTPINLNPLLHLLFENTNELPIAGALWFLTSLFFVDITYFIMKKFIKNEVIISIFIFIIAILGCLAINILPFRLPWALDTAFVGIGLYHIAQLMKIHMRNKYIYTLFHMRWFQCLFWGVVCCILIFTNGYINMRIGRYSIIPLFWINAIMAILIGWNISRFIEKISVKCSILKMTSLWLKNVGKNSIIYVCLNQLVIYVYNIFANYILIPQIVNKIIELILVMFILYICDLIIRNTKLKIIIGR